MEVPEPGYKRFGFVMLVNDQIDALVVTGKLSMREFKVILLIHRLTEGCHIEWARLRMTDFKAAGIAGGHIKQVLVGLTAKGFIEVNRGNYCLATGLFDQLKDGADEANEHLRWLVGQHLPDPRTGKRRYTNSVRKYSPFKESKSYQTGSDPDWVLGQVISGNETDSEIPTNTSKDTVKNTVKESINGDLKSSFRGESPILSENSGANKTMSPSEGYAKWAWNKLEPGKPESLPFYLEAFQKNNHGILIGFVNELSKDPEVKNKGAAFVSRVKGLNKKEDGFELPF